MGNIFVKIANKGSAVAIALGSAFCVWVLAPHDEVLANLIGFFGMLFALLASSNEKDNQNSDQ